MNIKEAVVVMLAMLATEKIITIEQAETMLKNANRKIVGSHNFGELKYVMELLK